MELFTALQGDRKTKKGAIFAKVEWYFMERVEAMLVPRHFRGGLF